MNTGSDEQMIQTLKNLDQLKGYLRTNIEISGPNVKITAKNIAPYDLQLPRVVFTGVGLAIAHTGELRNSRGLETIKVKKFDKTQPNPPNPRLQDEKYLRLLEIKYNRTDGKSFETSTSSESQQGELLFPGQGIVWEIDVSPEELAYMQFKVEGTLSRRHIFHNEYILSVPDSIVRPLALNALKSFNDLQVHSVLVGINQDKVFDGNTTLAEIQKYGNTLAAAILEIDAIEKKVQEIFHKGKFNWFQAHLRATFIYLESVKKASKKLQDAMASVKPDLIEAATGEMRLLIEEAYLLNRDTEELMAKHKLSDQDVNYQYRCGIGSWDKNAEQRQQVIFGNEWFVLPELAKRSLINADRTWASGPNGRIESILDDLKVAAEQLLFHGLWNQLAQWDATNVTQRVQKQQFARWTSGFDNSDNQPDLLDFQRAIEFPVTNAYLEARHISEEDRIWFIDKLPDGLYKLRKARNEAVHPDPDNVWTREKLKPYVEEFLGTDKPGTLHRIAMILFSPSTKCN